jgi:hypothetical protein
MSNKVEKMENKVITTVGIIVILGAILEHFCRIIVVVETLLYPILFGIINYVDRYKEANRY